MMQQIRAGLFLRLATNAICSHTRSYFCGLAKYMLTCSACTEQSRVLGSANNELATSKALAKGQPDGWARGEREGYGGPYDVTSLSLRA